MRTRIRLILLSLLPAPLVVAVEPPQASPHDNFQNVVRLPDGRLWRLASRFNAIYYSQSTDNGLSWQGGFTAGYKLFDAFGGLNPQPAVDAAGALHLFVPRRPESGPVEFDIWHYQSNPQLSGWSTGELIHNGNTGSMVKALHTRSGRLIAPFGDKAVPPPPGFGNNTTLVRYRDAGTGTFLLSTSQLRSAVPSDWNGASDGACEPTLIEKHDGSLWMLLRSQTGKLTESFSADSGATWTSPVNSRFYSSTGPPNLVRMDNGDMVLLWNNATMPQKHNGKIWYAGRDVLHAAVSKDDGATWSGFREVYRDPFRNDNPPDGDTGTAYSFAAPTVDGRIIAITGQAAAKTQLRIDPAWLSQKNQADDFTGADPLSDWSVFKPYGDVVNVKRPRIQGPQIIDDPDPARTKPVLHVRRSDEKDPDGATWNFPAAARGRTSVRIQLQPGFAGGAIALTDRFFNPTDTQGEAQAFFRLPIAADGSMGGLAAAPPLQVGAWHEVTLDYQTATRRAIVSVDGSFVGTLAAQGGINVWPGLSYLRLRSTAAAIDTAGFLVDAVSHVGSKLRQAERMDPDRVELALSTATEGDAATWTRLRFDKTVPNGNVTPTNPSGNGVTGRFVTPFRGFEAQGLLIESSAGTVTFTDATSGRVTSDLLGPGDGQTLSLRFVDPADGVTPAAVSEVAWRLGSVVADNVEVRLFDAEGEQLPDFLFAAAPPALHSAEGFVAIEDGTMRPLIHEIRFNARGSDVWVLGSFAQDVSLNDFAFRGLAVIPEPFAGCWSIALPLLWRRPRCATPRRSDSPAAQR